VIEYISCGNCWGHFSLLWWSGMTAKEKTVAGDRIYLFRQLLGPFLSVVAILRSNISLAAIAGAISL